MVWVCGAEEVGHGLNTDLDIVICILDRGYGNCYTSTTLLFFLLAFTLDPLSEAEEMHYLFWCFYILKHFFLTLRLINHLSVVLLFNINETMTLVSQQSSIIFWSNCVTFVEIVLVLDEKHIWCTKCAKFLSFTQSRKTDNLLQTCFLSIDPQLKRPVAFPPFYRFITLFTQFEQKHSIVNAPPYWGIIKLKDNS